MVRRLVGVMLAAFVASIGAADAEIYFLGIPSSRVVSTADNTTRMELSKEEALQYAVVISRTGSSYYWTSRNGLPLSRTVSGAYDIFSSLDGSGFVKVQNQALPWDAEPGAFPYFEIIHQYLESGVYFGSGQLTK